MPERCLAYFISCHGFGHLTRSLAVIEDILKRSEYSVCVISGRIQNNFARIYLKGFEKRVLFFDSITDIGLINRPKSLLADKELTEKELTGFVGMWDILADEQAAFLMNCRPSLIVSDISPLAFLVGDKLKINSIGISNFTWIDQYEYLGIDSRIIQKFRDAYSRCASFIKLPFSLGIKGIECFSMKAGYLSRPIEADRVKYIRQKYASVFFVGIGKASEMNKIRIKGFRGAVFYTEGLEIEAEDADFIKIDNNSPDTQNYIGASDHVLIKAGWSSVSEALVGHRPMCVIERGNVLEDINTIKQLKAQKLAVSIAENETQDIDFAKLKEKFKEIDIKKLNKIENEVEKVTNLLIGERK